MRPTDLSPRGVPPIRRLVVVALTAVLALVAARSVLAGDDPLTNARAGAALPSEVRAQVDDHPSGGLSAVLPAARRTSEHEALVSAAASLAPAAPAAARPAWALATDEPLPDRLLWAPLGARAPPARA